MIETLKIFAEPNDIIEIRTIGKVVASGYFNSIDLAVKEAKKHDGKDNIYFVLNKVSNACYHRDNRDKLVDKAPNTSDGDIEKRRWILLDFDPVRPSKISATDEEKAKSEEVMKIAARYLKDAGLKSPIIADSGNGWHLLYRVDMENSNESKKLVENFLKACDMLFSNDKVQVDKAVFNAARITKLYGSMAVKGANTEERPHRRSKITYIPKNIEINQADKIKAIADLMPKPKQIDTEFNLDDFLSKHFISVAKRTSWEGGTRYILNECPFDSAHGKDSAVIQLTTGALAFHCFHNGCSYNTWKEFRELYEPSSERKEYKKEYEKPKKVEVNLEPVISKELDQKTQEILSNAKRVKDIKPFDRRNIEIFKTGLPSLDKEMEVLFGKVGIVSGINGSGKSTMLGQLMLEAIDQGHNVFAYSGELKEDEFQFWIDLQAAGSNNLTQKTSKQGKTYHEINKEAKAQIHDWFGEHFWLYDNNKSMKYENILETIEAYRVHKNCRVIFLDNFMTIDISNLSEKDLQAQTHFIASLAKYVKQKNVLVFLVIHPKKIYEGIVQKQDILGTGNMSNAIDFMFLIHRVNETFKTHLANRKIPKQVKQALEDSNNVLEVGKDRWTGKEGLNIPMMYCPDSKRLVDAEHLDLRNKRYSWEKEVAPGFYIAPDEELPWMNKEE
jgi:archaellum biogenesis ATPase FlaH